MNLVVLASRMREPSEFSKILQKEVGRIRAPMEQYDRDAYGSLFTVLFTPDVPG